jgi:hypothetical protein
MQPLAADMGFPDPRAEDLRAARTLSRIFPGGTQGSSGQGGDQS